jgi:hypothetical protein
MLQRDTIMLVNDCFVLPIDLLGSGSTPLIIADDHDFGAVIVDSTKCAPVGIKNVGTAPLTLTKQWLMDNYGVNFSFPDSALLPMQLQPGQKKTLTICFTPHEQKFDSSVMHWGTNLVQPYAHSIKDTSILLGIGVKAGFVWDRVLQQFMLNKAVPNDSEIVRIWLYNNTFDHVNGPTVHVDKVFISGADAAEFYILQDRLNQLPMINFDLNPGDSVWVDVVFKPDLTKGYADRHADLVAHGLPSVEKDQIVNMTGSWANSDVKAQPQLSSFTIRPNPASGRSIILSFSLPSGDKVNLSIFDVLGREVYHEARGMMSAGDHDELVALPNLETGIYYLRLTIGGAVRTEKLEIVK